MALMSELLVSALILIGAFFLFVGSFGLVKLPDILRRLHAPTKATTLGIGSLLLASMAYFALVHGTLSLHELIISLFLFLTAPITAHMIAKAHLLRNPALQRNVPHPPRTGWATMTRPDKTARSERRLHPSDEADPSSGR